MRGSIPPLPNTPSQRGARLKNHTATNNRVMENDELGGIWS